MIVDAVNLVVHGINYIVGDAIQIVRGIVQMVGDKNYIVGERNYIVPLHVYMVGRVNYTNPAPDEGVLPMAEIDYIPNADAAAQSWTANFLTVANGSLAQIGLVAGDLAPITAAKTAFDVALLDVTAKEAAYKAAVQNKNTRRKSLDDAVRPVVRKIQATPGVPNSLKANLKITVRDTNPTPAVPVPPLNLVARGLDTGTNTLAWARSTNRIGTQFVIEAKANNAATWSLVDVVTVTRYQHTGQQPGVPIVYRVRARRGKESSDPSNEASVYAE